MFNADDAKRLLERTKARSMPKGRKKWHLKDALEIKKVENKIKRCCKKGDRK